MKFIKGISLFFIYPMTMFAAGFASNMAVDRFFYPGESIRDNRVEKQNTERDLIETGTIREPVMQADTEYYIYYYDMFTGQVDEVKEEAPLKYIGMNRKELEEEIMLYNKSPSLTDQEKGFSHMELISFSPARIAVRKYYEKAEDGYFLVNENNYVVVYDKSITHVYMETGIKMEDLPWELQREIIHLKYIETEKELFHFLESFSS